MTKKDYIAFANMLIESKEKLQEAKKENREITGEGMLKAIRRDVADIFLNDNPRFDYSRFIDYIDGE